MEPKNERYQIFYDFTSNGDSVTWASGNAGFGLTGVPKTPLDYPTMQDDNGYIGNALNWSPGVRVASVADSVCL